MAQTLELTLGYRATDFERVYKLPVDTTTKSESEIKTAIKAYNANLPAADKKIFISDDYDDMDSEDIIGSLEGIKAARLITVTETKIV